MTILNKIKSALGLGADTDSKNSKDPAVFTPGHLDREKTRELSGERSKKITFPRAARIQLDPLHHLSFTLKEPNFTPKLEVANLSVSGIGFLRSASANWPKEGTIIKGTLKFQDGEQPIVAKVVHFSNTVVGCSFTENTEVLREKISNYFKLELIATKMNVVSPKMLKADSEGTPFWIYGDNNCELYFVTDPANADSIRKYHLAFFGNYVEGGKGSPARFGRITEETRIEEVRQKSAEVVQWENDVSKTQIEDTIRFVQNISHLTDAQREMIVGTIRKGT